MSSATEVYWARLVAFYMEHNERRLDHIDGVLEQFSGYEDAMLLTLQQKYRKESTSSAEAEEKEVEEELMARREKERHGTFRYRIIRMYARHQPAKLRYVDKAVALTRKEDPHDVINAMTLKYGPEPTEHPKDLPLRERALIMYAYYNRWDEIDNVDRMIQLYQGMEDLFISRLAEELGPEPDPVSENDPMNPKARLKRFLSVYNPMLVNKCEVILARYEGRETQLFGLLQKKYGREPTEEAAQESLQQRKREMDRLLYSVLTSGQSTSESIQHSNAAIRTRGKKTIREQLRRGALRLDDEEAKSVQVVQRDRSLEPVRAVITTDTPVTEGHVRTMVNAVFRAYDPHMLPVVQKLVRKRFASGINEGLDFLRLIYDMYANAAVHKYVPTLRSIVSLLHIKLGRGCEEVDKAGGVEAFLATVKDGQESDWSVYFVLLYGRVTESELAARNRLRCHFLHYNPGVDVHTADEMIATFNNNPRGLYAALVKHYGPEPPPLDVDVQAVIRILMKNAPERVKEADIIIEAHTDFGDSPEVVLQKIRRSYGHEQNAFDIEVAEKVFAAELEDRFGIFASEERLRHVFSRRLEQTRSGGSGGVHSRLRGTARAVLATMSVGRAVDVQAATPQQQLQFVEDEEVSDRMRIIQEQDDSLQAALQHFDAIFLYVSTDDRTPLDLQEAIGRLLLEEDCFFYYTTLEKHMADEEEAVKRWLSGRLFWRQKWAEEEQKRQQQEEALLVEAPEEVQRNVEQEELEHTVHEMHAMDAAAHNETMKLRLDELNRQAQRVLQFDAAVLGHRRANKLRVKTELPERHRHLHRDCALFKMDGILIPPLRSSNTDTQVLTVDPLAEGLDVESTFMEQCEAYLAALFSRYDPGRSGSESTLLQSYVGRERKLVAALEEQYNVHRARDESARKRLINYLTAVRPDRIADVDHLMIKFRGREEHMWQHLYHRFGPDPTHQSDEFQFYLRGRLVRYLAVRAPHLLPKVDDIISESGGVADLVFANLTAQFGPEGEDEVRKVLERKILDFFHSRDLRIPPNRVRLIAQRYVGREESLNLMLYKKFGEGLDGFVDTTL